MDYVKTRSPKHLGNFGEALATYALVRKGFEVAVVDHIGADLIAEKDKWRYAISVKTRLFKPESKESLMTPITFKDIEHLNFFSEKFKMTGLFAHVLCLADERVIHLFMMRTKDVPEILPRIKEGYSMRFSKRSIGNLMTEDRIDCCSWHDESIGDWDFV